MRSIRDREKALNMYYGEGRGLTEIATALDLPVNTVKSWVRRYRLERGLPKRSEQYGDQLVRQKPEVIKVKRAYKAREKTEEQTTEERIATLEMEVDLLRNFLLESERRWMPQ